MHLTNSNGFAINFRSDSNIFQIFVHLIAWQLFFLAKVSVIIRHVRVLQDDFFVITGATTLRGNARWSSHNPSLAHFSTRFCFLSRLTEQQAKQVESNNF